MIRSHPTIGSVAAAILAAATCVSTPASARTIAPDPVRALDVYTRWIDWFAQRFQ